MEELLERDERDATREHAPMKPADDAIEVDTTGLSIDEVVARIIALVPRPRLSGMTHQAGPTGQRLLQAAA